MEAEKKSRFTLVNPDEGLVRLIDDTKYSARAYQKTKMALDFNSTLNDFIKKWDLGTDPHMFASLPKEKK